MDLSNPSYNFISVNYYLKHYGPETIYKVIDWVLIITFLGMLLNLLNLNWIIQIFVNRALYDSVNDSARGLTSFDPEQSRISEQMGLIFFVYLLLGALNKKRLFFVILAGGLSFAAQFAVVSLELLISFLIASILIIF